MFCTRTERQSIKNGSGASKSVRGTVRAKSLFHVLAVTSLLTSVMLLVQAQLTTQVGYITITADAGSVVPAGSALFSFASADGVLVSQAAVGATQPIRSGRIFVDDAGSKTGVALANPAAVTANLSLILRDRLGATVASTGIRIGPQGQTAQFVSEVFPNLPKDFVGTLGFDSDQPVAPITLRQGQNGRGEPIYATLPVVDSSANTTVGPVVFPHIAVGDGYTTRLLLLNPTSLRMSGRVRLYSSDGLPLGVNQDGSTVSEFAVQIEPQGMFRTEFDGLSGLAVGYAAVTADIGSGTPAGSAIFRYKSNGVLVTEAGVPAGIATSRARIFVDQIGTKTGVALVNPGARTESVTLTLMDRYGGVQARTARDIPAGNHTALFADELFTVPAGFSGLMEISSITPIVPIALRLTVNTRGDLILTSLPIADMTHAPSGGSLVFPQIAIGGGFSTRLIFINGSSTSAASGEMNFYRSDGIRLAVPLADQTGSVFRYQLGSGGGRQFYPGEIAPLANVTLTDALGQTTTEVTVNQGNTTRATLQMVDSRGVIRDDYDAVFGSLDTSVATIDSTGIVTGKTAGFSTLTIKAGGIVSTATITVTKLDAGSSGFQTQGVVADLAGRLYLASPQGQTILQTQSPTEAPAVYAGTPGQAGLKNDVRTQSQFRAPSFLTLNHADGSLFVSDAANHAIRKVQPGPAGRVETFAGIGTSGADDGSLSAARFNNPKGVTLDNRGNLWVVDSGNHTIRRIRLTTGVVETIAGKPGSAGFVDGSGTDARFNSPSGLALQPETTVQELERQRLGLPSPPVTVIVADTGNGVLRRVKETGEVETLAVASSPTTQVLAKPKSGMASTSVSALLQFASPSGVSVDPFGNIYVSEGGTGQVREILQNGAVVSAAQPNTLEATGGIATGGLGKLIAADNRSGVVQISYGSPVITSITPNRIGAAGGAIRIAGKNFAPDSLLIAGGVVIPGARIEDTQTITAALPALPSGLTTVTVQSRGGLAQQALLVDAIPLSQLQPGYVTTFAGGSTFAGDGSPARSARLLNPEAVTLDSAGNLFIADTRNDRVRRVSVATGIITTVAGSGQEGFGGDNGPATAAALHWPRGVAVDVSGDLYITDYFNERIRKVSAATGQISTFAGNGQAGWSGDGGPAILARIGGPLRVVLDANGNVLASHDGHIRRIDVATGLISTIAGSQPGYSGDGGPAVAASLGLFGPWGMTFDRLGNLFLADRDNHRIRRIDAAAGIISTVVGTGQPGGEGAAIAYPSDVAVDPSGNLVIGVFGGTFRVDAATSRITLLKGDSSGGSSFGVALDSAGNIYIADSDNGAIRKIAGGQVTTIAGADSPSIGDGGPAVAANVAFPSALVFDAAGNLFIADTHNNRIRKVDASNGVISTVAGSGLLSSGDNGPALSAGLSAPRDVAFDRAGNLLIVDTGGASIRRVDKNGIITRIAGNGLGGFSGDGGKATAATMYRPTGMAIGAAGDIYIADTGNHRLRKVDAQTGNILTIAGDGNARLSGDGGPASAASLAEPAGIALDAAGNIYLADSGNGRIRQIDARTGFITTIAGGFFSPTKLAFDKAGNLFVADGFNNRIRKIDLQTRLITTVAGNGVGAFSADNKVAVAASLRAPEGLAFDASDNLFIADTGNARIRAVRAPLP